MSPILIVGAGPVGLTMAAELVRYGVPVRVIDRSPRATDTSKALVVWSRTLELMDRMGCTPAFLEVGLRAHGATMRSGKAVLGHAGFDGIASPYNFALMIPQRDTERLLTAHLDRFGVSIERQVELVLFTDAEDHVDAHLTHADGRQETMETPWLIGCDGAHSTVRHGLDLDFKGYVQGDDWMLADVRLEGSGAPARDEISPYLHRDGPFVIFPIPDGRARIVAELGKTDMAHPRPAPTLADVQNMVDHRTGGGFRAVDPVWLSNFRINERKVADYRRGRVFLAGDAAHVHSPAGGQGMNTGMQDAINLAWKLAMVTIGCATDTLLDTYSSERSAVGDLVLRNASRLTDLGTITNPTTQAMRNLVLRVLLGLHAVQDRMAAEMSEIQIGYPHSPISIGHAAGLRLPPKDYGGPPPGSGTTPRFVLYTADHDDGKALAERFPALLETEPRAPVDASRVLIVRPDGYIGFSVVGASGSEADDYLQRLVPEAA